LIYTWIEILGLISFAISGTLTGLRKRLDIFGVVVIAFITSMGGGTLRDVLLGDTPVRWLKDIDTPMLIFFSSVLTIFFRNKLSVLSKSLFLFDTLGIGLFTILGVEKGLMLDIHPVMCIALGAVSACFGGVLRDILCNEIPVLFRKEIYATACIIGGILYVLLRHWMAIDNEYATVLSITLIVMIRMWAVLFKKDIPSLYKEKNTINE